MSRRIIVFAGDDDPAIRASNSKLFDAMDQRCLKVLTDPDESCSFAAMVERFGEKRYHRCLARLSPQQRQGFWERETAMTIELAGRQKRGPKRMS